MHEPVGSVIAERTGMKRVMSQKRRRFGHNPALPSFTLGLFLIPSLACQPGPADHVREVDTLKGGKCKGKGSGPKHCNDANPEDQLQWTQIDSGESSTCGLLSNGEIYCWGSGPLGLGPDAIDEVLTPEPIVLPASFGGSWVSLSVADLNACAIDNLGQAFCWGWNNNGQLGDPAFLDNFSDTPIEVSDPAEFSGQWVLISVGDYFVCGIDSARRGYCWGRGDYGIIGDGDASTQSRRVPTAVVEPTIGFSGWETISTGHVDSCGLDRDGRAHCWGYNHGTKPTTIDDPADGTWRSIRYGAHHACGVSSAQTIHCFGSDFDGSLGNGPNSSSSSTPVPVDSRAAFTHLGLDGESWHSCGLSNGGEIHCWGYNPNGEAGIEAGQAVESPHPMGDGRQYVFVSIGEYTSCGIAVDGHAYCWGYGGQGALGNGTLNSSHIPTQVAAPF